MMFSKIVKDIIWYSDRKIPSGVVLDVRRPGSIPTSGKENFCVRTRFLECHLQVWH